MQPLQARVFELRHNLSAYDAMYVALAEVLRLPLLTDDAKFACTPVMKPRFTTSPTDTASSGDSGAEAARQRSLMACGKEPNQEPTTTVTRPFPATYIHDRCGRAARQATPGDAQPQRSRALQMRATRSARAAYVRATSRIPGPSLAGHRSWGKSTSSR
jgi:hypothetical protein